MGHLQVHLLSLLVIAISLRTASAKTAYLSDCFGSDNQRWMFRPGRFVHHTLLRLAAYPDWCLVHYAGNMSSPMNTSSLFVDLCDVAQPSSRDYQARVWSVANNTIQTTDATFCLADVVTGDNSSLTLLPCAKMAGLHADYATLMSWSWNDTGLIAANGSSPSKCLSVNMSSPTPPHPTPSIPGFNIQAAECDPSDKLQRWSGYPYPNGTIHHVANTSYCVAAYGLYPGTHGPNVVLSLCNASDLTQIYQYDNKTSHLCSTTDMICGGTAKEECCLNIGHTTETPQPGNNIELYGFGDQLTEEWHYDTGTQQLQSAGLCMTIVK